MVMVMVMVMVMPIGHGLRKYGLVYYFTQYQDHFNHLEPNLELPVHEIYSLKISSICQNDKCFI
jgi:hypothetical protein